MNLRGGGLSQDLSVRASVAGNSFRVLAADVEGFEIAVVKTTGILSGIFKHPTSGKLTPFKGIYLQRQKTAAGFFIGSEASGQVLLTRD